MKARAHLRRGALREGEASGHGHILATASELFYRETFRAIGIDTVVERSGVSKTNTAPCLESGWMTSPLFGRRFAKSYSFLLGTCDHCLGSQRG